MFWQRKGFLGCELFRPSIHFHHSYQHTHSHLLKFRIVLCEQLFPHFRVLQFAPGPTETIDPASERLPGGESNIANKWCPDTETHLGHGRAACICLIGSDPASRPRGNHPRHSGGSGSCPDIRARSRNRRNFQ